MLKKFFYILFFVSSCAFASAQEVVDSLEFAVDSLDFSEQLDSLFELEAQHKQAVTLPFDSIIHDYFVEKSFKNQLRAHR